MRCNQHDDLAAIGGFGLLPKDRTHDRQAAEQRDLGHRAGQVVTDQAANHYGGPVPAHDIGRYLRDFLVGQRKSFLDSHATGRQFRMHLHANHTVARDKRSQTQLRADLQEFHGLRRGVLGNRGADVAQLRPDQNLGPLLV